MDRRRARIIALQVLYSCDLQKDFSANNLDKTLSLIDSSQKQSNYSKKLVTGICENKKKIDSIIAKYSKNWKISRMSVIDRNILRIGIHEYLCSEEVPFKVIIDEAIEISKEFGDSDSSSFVNGILDTFISEKIKSAKETK